MIDVEVELTANHKGFFELRLCPLSGDPTSAETQECFNKHPLYLEGKSTYRFQIPDNTNRQETFNYRVKLPDGVTCSRCVIQWIYYTGKLSSKSQEMHLHNKILRNRKYMGCLH